MFYRYWPGDFAMTKNLKFLKYGYLGEEITVILDRDKKVNRNVDPWKKQNNSLLNILNIKWHILLII